jgi:abhydrolase domain-containing protein 4
MGFKAIAEHFGYAKNPMIKRIDKVDPGIPICFIHGSRSWLDSTVGFLAIQTCQSSSISVKLITGAGHHVYADKPEEFNEYVNYYLETLEDCDDENFDEINNNDYNNSYNKQVNV